MSNTSPKPSSTALYKRLLGYAFKYKSFFVLGTFGFLLFSGMETILIMTVEFFFDALENRTSARLSFLPPEITGQLLFVPSLIVFLAIFRGLGSYMGNFYISRVGLSVVNDLRKEVFSHMVGLPQHYYDKNNSGELVALIIYNIDQVTRSVTDAVKILFRDGLSLLFILGLLIYYNWKLTLVFFAVTPVLAGLVYLASRYFLRISRKIQQAIGMVTHIATESFQGIKLVKSFRGENYEKNRFMHAANENLRFATKFERVKAIQTPVLHIIIAFALATIILLVLLFWNDTPAAAIAYVSAAGLIAKPFRSLTSINSTIQKGIAAAETIFSALDHELETNTGNKLLENPKGKIEFKNAVFSYNETETAIKGLNLVIEPGETIALVGESGSGKSTLANLLLRFYDLSDGEILIDGLPIQEIELGNLRTNIALVNQQAILFHNSIRANIAYGEDLKNATEDEIQAAAENAYATSFIDGMEQGFDSNIGEAGDKLSGGQRQRLTIARALLKNAPILILDEATSALDNDSEKKIQDALDQLKQGRTTIIIAHRLSTIENADKIAVMDKGRLVELGNHASLINKGGHYASLYNKSLNTDEDSA